MPASLDEVADSWADLRLISLNRDLISELLQVMAILELD
jgi:hypothetical protein